MTTSVFWASDSEQYWFAYVAILSEIWTWSELVVMLTNPEKRALHDFIAGTIVIKREYLPIAQDTELGSAPVLP